MGINKKIKRLLAVPVAIIVMMLAWGFINYLNTKSPDDSGNLAGAEAVAGTAGNVSGYAWSENIGWISFECKGLCNPPVASGAQIYDVTSGSTEKPKFTTVTLDPLDVQVGGVQVVTAEVKDVDGNPITSVTGSFLTDIQTTGPVSFSLISGTNIEGTWQGSWTMPNDTYCYNYGADITATSASGSNTVELRFDTDVSSCEDVDYGVYYGVNVDSLTGAFSGYAWSENIGWIKFDPAGPYPGAPSSSATLNLSTNEVSGWARACAGAVNPDCTGGTNPDSGGWDGWIKMRGTVPNYGVSLNPGTKEFSGFAWGSDVIGWISFNCADLGACGSSNYKVIGDIGGVPSASGLSVSIGDYCTVPSHFFSWTFLDPEDGVSQASYALEADNNSDFSSPEVSSSGGSGTAYTAIVAVNSGANQLGYNTSYSWRVKVFDSDGADSGWVNGTDFVTEPHLYPDSGLTFSPSVPSQDEEITFMENTTCYEANNNAIPCPVSTTTINYSWDFDFETPPFSEDATGQVAATAYSDTATHTVALDVTDQDANTCRGTQDISLQSPLPEFKETAPSN